MSQSLGTLLARLGADTTQFDAALTRSQMRMKTVGKTMKRIGMSMSMALTLPLALIGAASFKMAKDFEASLSKVVGLVGVAREQVNAWKDDILNMAPEVGKTPKELGEALFFVTSAGIRGAEAMEVLKVSAQAASAGLGETKSVADLVTSAMNAYGSENLNATQATDILVAAVREGKAEASELAESMGMVLPLASEMGVKFYEVGAAVAAMTRTGTNAATASMQLRQILASLIKPTDQAKDTLVEMGTSASSMRKMIREKGLIVALQKLKKITSEYGEEAMSKVFPNIRALSGVLDIMGSNAKDNIDIFDRMSDSTGSLDKAFEAAAKTTDFKWNAAMSRGNVALIKLGYVVKEIVMPIITGFSRIIEGLGKWFEGLSDSGKKLVVVIAGITMVAGPLLIVLGFLTSTVLPMLIAKFATLNAVILANPIAALITVLALVTTAMLTFKKRVKEVIPFQTQFTNLLSREKTKLDSLFTSLDNAAEGTREREEALEQINKIYKPYLANALTEKSTTEDIAKAYERINTAMMGNVALKAKKEKTDRIINESLEKQNEIINGIVTATQAETKDATKAALAYARVYDIVKELRKGKIFISKPFGGIVNKEVEAAKKIFELQNQQQMDLNNTNLFFEQILKDIGEGLDKTTFSQEAFTGAVVKTQAELDSLFFALNRTTKGTKAREIAIGLVNKRYGKYLENALTEKSTTKDIANAYELINAKVKQNIAIKYKEARVLQITTAALKKENEILDKIVSDVTLKKSATEAAIAYGRVLDIVEELRKKKITIPIDLNIEDMEESVSSIMSQLKDVGSKITLDSSEVEAAIKVCSIQNIKQKDLNDTYSFYVEILKAVEEKEAKLAATRIAMLETQKNELRYMTSLGTRASSLSKILEFLGFDYVNLEKMGSDALTKLADIVIPNMDRIKKKIDDAKQAMKDSIPIILEYRTAFEGFDATAGIVDTAADTVEEQIERLNSAIQSGLESLAVTFAEGLGDLMAGDATFKDFGNNALYAVGQFIKQMGSALIVFSGLMAAFEEFAIAHPYAAIAIGIAAIAAGQLLMSKARKGPNIQGLATGGVVTSGGIFEVGEKGKETVYLPAGSAVTPHKAGGAQELFGIIRGEDIYISNKRYIDKLGRVT